LRQDCYEYLSSVFRAGTFSLKVTMTEHCK
jgi:hypothetical protein